MPARWTRNLSSKNLSVIAARVLRLALLHCVCLHAQGGALQTGFAPEPTPGAVPPVVAVSELTELLLVIEVNGQAFGEPAVLLQDLKGRLYVAGEDLRRWRLRLPATAPLPYQGADYFALAGYDGLQYVFDSARQALTIRAQAGLFQPSTLEVPAQTAAMPTLPALGGFFNYELMASYASHDTQGAGQFELGIFKGNGVGTMGMVAPQLGGNSRLVRLDATWSTDNTKERESWRFGDVVNRAGAWGRSVRLGGVQFGSNFATQPGFISAPVQQAAGQAALPSTVDVYVNNALASHREVPPGPFSITNLPVVTGSGEVRLVVRDLMGREQVITQSIYASAGLLAAGLQDYSYEIGLARANFGINSNDYGDWVAVATHRQGLSDRFTGEVHLEWQAQQKTLGISGLYLLPLAGVVNATLAASQGNGARGALAALGFERQTPTLSFALRSQWSSRGFGQLGADSTHLPAARQWSANAGYATRDLGSIGLSYLHQNLRDQASIGIATASYTLALQRHGTLTLSMIGTSGAQSSTQMAMVWTLPLGADHGVSVTYNRARSNTLDATQELVATLQKSVPVGEGTGYQVQAYDSGDLRGAFIYQNNAGTYGLEAARFSGEGALRASVRAGVALLGAQPYFSRWIEDSFGVARVAGFPNVRVYADNQLVGRTNAAGDAMLARLRPYESNQIRIDPRDLPLNAQVDALRVQAVPYFRSGVLAEFPVRPALGALLHVLLDNGQPLPAGSTVEHRGGQTRFPVADDGEVYVTGLAPRNRLRARWKNQVCEFDLAYEPTDDPLPDLGAFTCKGITP